MKSSKPKTTRSLLAALALCAGLLGRAEDQPQPIDGVLTFDVPEGAIVRYAEPLGADIRQLVKLGAGTHSTPFGNKACIVIHKGGAANVIKAKYAKLYLIYNKQSFTVPTAVTMKYLEPGS